MSAESIAIYVHIALALVFVRLTAPLALQGLSCLETVVRRYIARR